MTRAHWEVEWLKRSAKTCLRPWDGMLYQEVMHFISMQIQCSCKALQMAPTVFGVVRQHPPISWAPAFRHSCTYETKSVSETPVDSCKSCKNTNTRELSDAWKYQGSILQTPIKNTTVIISSWNSQDHTGLRSTLLSRFNWIIEPNGHLQESTGTVRSEFHQF